MVVIGGHRNRGMAVGRSMAMLGRPLRLRRRIGAGGRMRASIGRWVLNRIGLTRVFVVPLWRAVVVTATSRVMSSTTSSV